MTITFIINALPQNYIENQTLSKHSTDRLESYLIWLSDTCQYVDLFYGCYIICSEAVAVILPIIQRSLVLKIIMLIKICFVFCYVLESVVDNDDSCLCPSFQSWRRCWPSAMTYATQVSDPGQQRLNTNHVQHVYLTL